MTPRPELEKVYHTTKGREIMLLQDGKGGLELAYWQDPIIEDGVITDWRVTLTKTDLDGVYINEDGHLIKDDRYPPIGFSCVHSRDAGLRAFARGRHYTIKKAQQEEAA